MVICGARPEQSEGSPGSIGCDVREVRIAPQDVVGCHVAFGSSQSTPRSGLASDRFAPASPHGVFRPSSRRVSEYRDFVGFRHSGLDPESSLFKEFWIQAFAGKREESGIPTLT